MGKGKPFLWFVLIKIIQLACQKRKSLGHLLFFVLLNRKRRIIHLKKWMEKHALLDGVQCNRKRCIKSERGITHLFVVMDY